MMSETELKLLKQDWSLDEAGSTAEYTPHHHEALTLWADANDRAFAESDVRFTIAEVDEMLAV